MAKDFGRRNYTEIIDSKMKNVFEKNFEKF
jgi:hypothetical protein